MFPTETCSSRKVQEVTCCQPATTVRLLVFMYIRALLYLIGGFFVMKVTMIKEINMYPLFS